MLFIRYFWFICAVFMLVNLSIWRGRVTALVDRGVIGQAEADQFLRLATVWLVGGPCLLGLISVAASWSSPLCAGFLEFSSTSQALTSVIIIAGWTSLLWWVWLGSGAALLARVGPAITARSSDPVYSRQSVRLAITFLVLISAVGGVITRGSMPSSRSLTCPAAPVAGQRPSISRANSATQRAGTPTHRMSPRMTTLPAR
jgi:hypothetical protein